MGRHVNHIGIDADDDYHAEVTHRSPSETSIRHHVKHIGAKPQRRSRRGCKPTRALPRRRHHVKHIGDDADDEYHAGVTIGARGVTSIGHHVKHIGNEAATTFTQRLQTEARALPA